MYTHKDVRLHVYMYMTVAEEIVMGCDMIVSISDDGSAIKDQEDGTLRGGGGEEGAEEGGEEGDMGEGGKDEGENEEEREGDDVGDRGKVVEGEDEKVNEDKETEREQEGVEDTDRTLFPADPLTA